MDTSGRGIIADEPDPPADDGVSLDPAGAQFASTVRLVLMRVARRLRSQRADLTITLSQLSALATVAKSGPLNAGEVAAIERVQPPSMSKILNSLEALELIERGPHDSDRRQSVITATVSGHALLDEELRARDEWLAGRLEELSPADLEALRSVIGILDRLGSQ